MSDNLPVRYDPDGVVVPHDEFSELEKAKYISDEHLQPDLEKALNLIRGYQRALRTLDAPDSTYVEARQLLTKYGMAVGDTPSPSWRIYHDGEDITEHPDSIEGSTVEVEELEDGPDKLELVQDNETGKMYFRDPDADE